MTKIPQAMATTLTEAIRLLQVLHAQAGNNPITYVRDFRGLSPGDDRVRGPLPHITITIRKETL